MTRIVTVGAAQLGPIARSETRAQVVERMLALMRDARRHGCDLVVFPELALTTFFPRWYFEQQAEVDAFFERSMPGPETQPLFDAAREMRLGFYLGYAELAEQDGTTRRFNTSILVDKQGAIVSKYRKIHLPGHAEHEPWRRFQHLEKRYFEVGDLGWPVVRWAFGENANGLFGMAICNDRRWPETYRVMGLQGVEMVLLGYNTPVHNPPAPEHDALSHFHNEEGVEQIGDSIIVAPSGEIVAACTTTGDELAIARCDLDLCNSYKSTTFNFARHREPGQYRMIVERKGAVPPD
jgi:predicted amidohydrolase